MTIFLKEVPQENIEKCYGALADKLKRIEENEAKLRVIIEKKQFFAENPHVLTIMQARELVKGTGYFIHDVSKPPRGMIEAWGYDYHLVGQDLEAPIKSKTIFSELLYDQLRRPGAVLVYFDKNDLPEKLFK